MKNSLTVLVSIFLLTCWQVAATPPAPPAVGPQSAPEPQLLSPNFNDEYAEPTGNIVITPERYTTTRFQAKIVTLKELNEKKSTTAHRKEEQQQQQNSYSGLGIQYGWTRHQWMRDIDNTEREMDEIYRREIVVGVPLLMITVSTILSVALLVIEVYERINYYNNTEEDYSYYSPLEGC
jgi:hypothetical protein